MMQLFLSLVLWSSGLTQGIEFEKAQLKIAQHQIIVELAQSEQEHEHGLMFRKTLNPDTGMLFVFSDESLRHFWMKNTLIPLSIGYFDKNKKLVDVQEMQPLKSEMQIKIPTYVSKKPAQYALEMPRGWFKNKNVKVGDHFAIEKKLP